MEEACGSNVAVSQQKQHQESKGGRRRRQHTSTSNSARVRMMSVLPCAAAAASGRAARVCCTLRALSSDRMEESCTEMDWSSSAGVPDARGSDQG